MKTSKLAEECSYRVRGKEKLFHSVCDTRDVFRCAGDSYLGDSVVDSYSLDSVADSYPGDFVEDSYPGDSVANSYPGDSVAERNLFSPSA